MTKASAIENDSDEETCEKEVGCYIVQGGVYQNLPAFLVLKKHLDRGKNKYALEQEMLYDKAMTQVNWSMAVVPFLKL